MYNSSQILKRDFMNLVKNPMWIYYSTLFPFLLVVIMGFLFSGSYGSKVTSYDYYGITMMVFIILYTSTIASNSFMEERIKMSNMRIIYSPVRTSAIYLSKILATFVFSAICHAVTIVVLVLLFNVNFGGANIGYIIILFLLAEFFASVLGVMLCCIFKSESTANQILSMTISTFGALGGVFFQIDGLGKTVSKISRFSPVKWILEAAFRIIYDSDFSYFMPTVIILSVLSIFSLIACKLFFRTEDYI